MKLPQMGTRVLVVYRGDWWIGKRDPIGNNGGWLWLLATGGVMPDEITHWQPLPLLPAGGTRRTA